MKLENKDGTMVVNFYKRNNTYYIQYVFNYFISNRNFATDEVSAEVFYHAFNEMLKSGYKRLDK